MSRMKQVYLPFYQCIKRKRRRRGGRVVWVLKNNKQAQRSLSTWENVSPPKSIIWGGEDRGRSSRRESERPASCVCHTPAPTRDRRGHGRAPGMTVDSPTMTEKTALVVASSGDSRWRARPFWHAGRVSTPERERPSPARDPRNKSRVWH
jgi:hypothetical protein